MRCNIIQEAILADYSDNERWEERSKEVKSHLASCESCREFAKTVKEVTILPFEKIPAVKLDQESIWQNIKEEIKEEVLPYPTEPNLLKEFFENLFRPKVIWWTAKVAIILLVLAAQVKFIYDVRSVQSKAPSEDVEVLTYMVDEFEYGEHKEDIALGFDTDLEEYFL